MQIVAIDPGPNYSAFVRYQPIEGERCGYILRHAKAENHDVLGAIAETQREDTFLVIEEICRMSPNVTVGRDVFQTVRWSGRFEQAWLSAGRAVNFQMIPAAIYLPRVKVKGHLCRSARAKDPDVRAALIQRFGGLGNKKDAGPLSGITADQWSALAIAVTFADLMETEYAR